MTAPVLSVCGLSAGYPRGGMVLHDISFELAAGAALGVVGESGCGKTTLARVLAGLLPPGAGEITCAGRPLTRQTSAARRAAAQRLQLVFQDPLAALNPRQTAAASLAEPLQIHQPDLPAAARTARVAEWLARIGLPGVGNRYPHELSGGQCQRLAIARALLLEPRVLVCDEPVSALDVSIQAQILALLAELQQATDLALLFIAHDLAVVRRLCREVLVLYAGRIVESGPTDAVFTTPRHPYTRALLAAVPRADGQPPTGLPGAPPPADADPPGCPFAPRCHFAVERCKLERPKLRTLGAQRVACHRAEEI